MLLVQNAAKPRRSNKQPRIGLAIAGGGPIGGIYELGVLRALDDALDGLELNDLAVYVGVSSGSFLAAGLANRLTSGDICRIFISNDSNEFPFRPESFLRPAFAEFSKRFLAIPHVLTGALSDLLRNPLTPNIGDVLANFGRLVPTGLFQNEVVHQFLAGVFTTPGRTNDFRELNQRLFVVAVDIDSGETVRFGAEGHDEVPISKAVQASSALPGLYPPVEIDGRYYVDGVLRRTLHASVALDEGVDLVIGINPLVPFEAKSATDRATRNGESLIEGGLPVVMSQTLRTLIQSRVQVGFGKYSRGYEHSDLVLIEPEPTDSTLFFSNPFSFSERRVLCNHAYRATLADLRQHRERIEPVLNRCGIRLRDAALDDLERNFDDSIPGQGKGAQGLVRKLHRSLDELESLLGDTAAQLRA